MPSFQRKNEDEGEAARVFRASDRRWEPTHLRAPAVRADTLNGRWMMAALLLGAISAFAAALVRLGFRGLEWLLTHSGGALPMAAAPLAPWRRVLTPVLGALLAMLVLFLQRRRGPKDQQQPQAYVEYVEAVRHAQGEIPFLPNCWRTVSAAFSVASGAAVGREGSMIQFAAAGSAAVGRWLGRGVEQGRWPPLALLVACGVAGGVTVAYNAPVAAVCFAVEIALGGTGWRELVLLALATAAGWGVSGAILGFHRLYPTPVAFPLHSAVLLTLPLFALCFGLLGPLYQAMIQSLHRGRSLPLPLLWGGVVVGALSLWDVRVWGNGDLGLDAALGHPNPLHLSIAVPSLALLLLGRLVATNTCVGTGTIGGVFTPTLFAGAASGALLGRWLPGGDPVFWAMAGMSCLLAAATHAPLMAACMAVELTGNWRLLPVLLIASLLSWLVARRLSGHALYAIATQAPTREHIAADKRVGTV